VFFLLISETVTLFLIIFRNWETFTVNLAVDTEQQLTLSASTEVVLAGLGYIGQASLSGTREKAYMAYRRARPGQAQAYPGLQAQARLDPREFGQAGPGFTEAWQAWPVGNTDLNKCSE